MKRATVKNLQNVVTHQADFTSEQLAQNWFNEERSKGSFGVVAHTQLVHPDYYDQHGNVVVPAEYEEVSDSFVLEITDVTAEYALNAALTLAKSRRLAGEGICDKIFAINMSKNLTQQQFQALLQNPTLGAVERLLKNGSLATAKALIESMDETYYTGPEKASIISDIDLALGG